MKNIQYISDIHLPFDFGWRLPITPKEDERILLVAGDICEMAYPTHYQVTEAWLKDVASRFRAVVWVAGNHEYYDGHPTHTEELLHGLAADTNTIYLQNQSVTIDGVRILGCTLWTDLNNHSPMAEFAVRQRMNDFVYIDEFDIDTWLMYHKESAEFLYNSVQQGDVVLTHHAPSVRSCPARYSGQDLNYGFACTDMDRLILDAKPQLWVHGHIHDRCSYTIGETLVCCNPKGYGDIMNPVKIVEVSNNEQEQA